MSKNNTIDISGVVTPNDLNLSPTADDRLKAKQVDDRANQILSPTAYNPDELKASIERGRRLNDYLRYEDEQRDYATQMQIQNYRLTSNEMAQAANASLPTLDIYDPVSRYKYGQAIRAKQRFNTFLDISQYQIANNPEIKKQCDELLKVREDPSQSALDKVKLQADFQDNLIKKFNDIVDEHGGVSEDLLLDRNFRKYCTPDVLQSFLNAREAEETINDERGFFSNFLRQWTMEAERRRAAVDFLDTGDKSEFDKRMTDLSVKYSRSYDGEVMQGVVSSLASLVMPMVDNPIKGTALAAAAVVTGLVTKNPALALKVLGYSYGTLVQFPDEYEQFQADMLNTGMNARREEYLKEHPNATAEELKAFDETLDRDDFLNHTAAAASVSSLLDIVGDRFFMRGVAIPLQPILSNAEKKAITSPVIAALKATAEAAAVDTGVNIVTEGMQDTINTAAALNASGANVDVLDRALDAGVESLKSAVAPSAILSTVFNTPRLFHNLHMYTKDFQAKSITEQRLVNGEKLAAKIEKANIPAENKAALYQKVFQDGGRNYAEMAFDPTQVIKIIDDLGLKGEQIPERFRNREKLLDMADHGEEIHINRGEFYAFFSPEQRDQFKTSFHFTDLGEKTLGTLNSAVDDARADKIADEVQQTFADENEHMREDQYIAGQIQGRLSELNIGTAETRAASGEFAAAFFRSMGEMLGVNPREVMSNFLYRLTKNEHANDLNLAGNKDEKYDKNIKGKTSAHERFIEFSPDADLGTMLEEFSHMFLLTVGRFEKEGKANEQLKAGLAAFRKWVGDEKLDLSEINEQNRYAHEAFISALFQYLITGQADQSNITALKTLKNMLMRVSSLQSLYYGYKPKDLQKDTGGAKRAAIIGGRYEQAYGHKLNALDDNFSKFISAMFGQQQKLLDENSRYSFSSIFAGEQNEHVILTDKDHKELAQTEADLQNRLEEKLAQASVVENPMVFEGLDKSEREEARKTRGTAQNTKIREAGKITKEKLSAYKKMVESLKEKRKEYFENFKRYFKESVIGGVYQTIRESKINESDPSLKMLSPEEIKALKEAGLVSKDGTLSAQDVENSFSSFETTSPENIASRAFADRFKAPVDVLKFLAKVPHEDNLAKFFTDEMMKAERQKLKDELTQADPGVYILDERIRQNAKEQAVINKNINGREEAQLCKSAAKKLIARTPFGQINVSAILNQASRVKKMAQTALRKGDLKAVAKLLRTERVLLEEARLASRLVPELEKRLKDHKNLLIKSDKELAKRYDVKMLMLARIVLSQIGIKDWGLSAKNFDLNYEANVSNPDIMNFYNLIAGNSEAGTVINGYYKNMTAQQVELVVRMLDSIQHISRKNGWLRNKGKFDIKVKDAQVQLLAALEKKKDRQEDFLNNKDQGGVPVHGKKLSRSFREAVRNYNYSFYRPEPFFQALDGKDTEGAWTRFVYAPIKNAEVRSQTELAEWRQAVRQAAERTNLKFNTNLVVDCPELKFSEEQQKATKLDHMTFGLDKTQPAQYQILGLLLHMGNHDNFNKLLKGYFGDNVTEEIFAQWFDRMCNEGVITKEMMDYTQAVWDINKKYFEGVQKAHYETHGYEVKVIEPRTIHTKWGDYRGGVVRAIANMDVVTDDTVKMNDVKDFTNAVERDLPTVKNGFTQERKSGAIRALCIDPTQLINETRNIILYANFQPAFSDVNKVLDAKTRAVLERKYPSIYNDFIKGWLLTTVQQSTTMGSKDGVFKNLLTTIGYVTRMAGQVLMAGNINNTLQQISGFSSLATKVPVSQIAMSLCRSLGHWGEMTREINSSEFMVNRKRNVNDGVENVFNDLIFSSTQYKDYGIKGKLMLKQAQTWTRQHAYFAQKFFQDYIDRVAYDAAYQHGLKQGKTIEEAQRYAESVVRTTQSSFDVADMANAEKASAGWKIFTQFGGYFYTMYRLQTSQIAMICARENVSSVHKALSIAWTIATSMIMTAVLAEAVNGIMNGSAFDDDDGEYARSLLWSIPKMYAGAFPLVGKVVNYGIEKLQGKNYYNSGFLNNPTIGQFETAMRLSVKAATLQEIKPNDLKAAINILAIMSGCPIVAMGGRTLSYGYGVAAGYYVPQSALDLIRGLLTGTASPQSKVN